MSDYSPSTAILINVDDHEPTRYARKRVLDRAGFTVHNAATGTQALRLIDEKGPDLVLLDVHLPDVDGIEVCRRIKTSALSAAVLVLQISASATTAPQAITALNTGADGYLVEPVDPDVLVATVRSLLRLRSAERALARANRELAEKNGELVRVNHALRRSNEDLERFAYLGSHDLQEPLRNITTHIQLLERLTAERFNEEERKLFSVVLEGAQRMGTLIQDVLAYSGIGREQPELTATALGDSLDMARENLSEGITSSGAKVTAGALPIVQGDAKQLSRVFQNLISNSIKYCSAEAAPCVQISAELDGNGDWLIRVRDNGVGIPEDQIDRVFEPFKRLHGRDIPGNGIGLALCRRIIEGHSGRIWAESGEGRGTTFLFTLRPVEPM